MIPAVAAAQSTICFATAGAITIYAGACLAYDWLADRRRRVIERRKVRAQTMNGRR